MQGTEHKTEIEIKAKQFKALSFPDDFADKRLADSIWKGFRALKDKGLIKPVAHGVYVCPKVNHPIFQW